MKKLGLYSCTCQSGISMHLDACEYQWAGREPRSKAPPLGSGSWAEMVALTDRQRAAVSPALRIDAFDMGPSIGESVMCNDNGNKRVSQQLARAPMEERA